MKSSELKQEKNLFRYTSENVLRKKLNHLSPMVRTWTVLLKTASPFSRQLRVIDLKLPAISTNDL